MQTDSVDGALHTTRDSRRWQVWRGWRAGKARRPRLKKEKNVARGAP